MWEVFLDGSVKVFVTFMQRVFKNYMGIFENMVDFSKESLLNLVDCELASRILINHFYQTLPKCPIFK